MYCANHPQTQAKAACVVCGKLFCEDCTVQMDGRYYCKEHAVMNLKERYVDEPRRDCRSEVHHHHYEHGMYSQEKSWTTTFLLCLFFGIFGFHRFYVGKVWTGLLYSVTGGLGLIGWIVDIIMLLSHGFRDANGRFLV